MALLAPKQEEIVGLDISMRDAPLVHVAHACCELPKKLECSRFREWGLSDQELGQVLILPERQTEQRSVVHPIVWAEHAHVPHRQFSHDGCVVACVVEGVA